MKIRIAIMAFVLGFLSITKVNAQHHYHRRPATRVSVVIGNTYPNHYAHPRYRSVRYHRHYRPVYYSNRYRYRHIPPGHAKKYYGYRNARNFAPGHNKFRGHNRY